MPPDDRARQLARAWIVAADRQLELATTALDRRMWNEGVALAAAATERYLKATLVAQNTPFEYTHNIDRLLARQPEDVRHGLEEVLTTRLRQQLTDGGTVARYPGGPSYTQDECRVAVDAATSVRVTLRAASPGLFDHDPE